MQCWWMTLKSYKYGIGFILRTQATVEKRWRRQDFYWHSTFSRSFFFLKRFFLQLAEQASSKSRGDRPFGFSSVPSLIRSWKHELENVWEKFIFNYVLFCSAKIAYLWHPWSFFVFLTFPSSLYKPQPYGMISGSIQCFTCNHRGYHRLHLQQEGGCPSHGH